VAGVAAAGGGAWLASLPGAPPARAAPVIPPEETASALAALRPPKRPRPLIASIGINDATEVTDYLMPWGVLKRSGVADVVMLATAPGPVKLFQALSVQPEATTAEFDARHPDGADYVIVPQMSRREDSQALGWIRAQAASGAIIVGVCAGARIVANAGLLDGRRGTTHWFFLQGMLQQHPRIRYVPDRRMVVDGPVATTTGITASMPAALTLIEAIAGRARAEAVAAGLGMPHWDLRHDSSAFRFSRPFATTVLANGGALWGHETLGVLLTPGIDEVSLALVADAWSRTYRSRVVTFAPSAAPVVSANGLRILPDRTEPPPPERRLPPVGRTPPAVALDEALAAIERRYGAQTASVVAMQLEYPRRRSA
jgi:transcriptional regulator GlxA family with amidase domain